MINQETKSKLTVIFTFIILFGMILAPYRSAQAGSPKQPNGPASGAHLRLAQADDERLVLEFTTTAPELKTSQAGGAACQVASLPGVLQSETPGLPALPVQGALLGIPQDAAPALAVLAVEWSSLPGSYDLCPTAQPVWQRVPQAPYELSGYSYLRAPAYQIDAFMPALAAELASTGNLRSQRYAQVSLYPLQYNPVSGELRYASRMVVELKFNLPAATTVLAGLQSTFIDEGPFEGVLRSQLLNYEQARPWRSRPVQPGSLPQASAAPQTTTAYKIPVSQDGVYKLSYTVLHDAGLPVDSLDPRTFKVTNQATQLAIYVEGEADGIFNASDYLLFYGQALNTKYTNTNIYWLTWGGSNGLRMASLNGAPSGSASVPADFLTTRHVELDTDYYSDDPSGAANDHWYWAMVDAYSAPAYVDFTTDLFHLGDSSHTITVRGLLKGYSANPNHHTRIYLNGNLIDDHSFPSRSQYSFSVNVPQSYLVEGTNTIRVECPRDGSITLDEVLVNWFEIDYYDDYFAENNRLFFDGDSAGTAEYQIDGFSTSDIEAFDITAPLAPVRVLNGTITATANGQQLAIETTQAGEGHYLAQTTGQRISLLATDLIPDAPTTWKSPTNAADYIIITHPDFLSQVQPLAAYRASQGLRVQTVNVQDLYDEFNGGVFSPEAIKSFLTYAYANWVAPAPSFVLLVGDGNFDFKNGYGWNNTNFVPPYLDDVDPWTGETATDNRYASVSGTDILPDLYIGRFPARSQSEAQTMVDKTLNYEQVAPSGGWNAQLHFIADNADSGGNFPVISDNIITTYVPPAYSVDKVNYGINYTSTSAARSAIMAAINQGRLIVHYIGHASIQMWASEGLMKNSDIASLTNGNKLPFFMPMTCTEGYFIWPSPSGADYSGLGEVVIRTNGRGAVASFSPTGYGLSNGHDYLDRSIFNDLFNNHQNQLGYLTTNAKYYLYANSSSFNDLIETYLLFGDPALRLQTLPAPPAAPTNLTATPVDGFKIDLAWQDNSNDETGFRIERSPDGSTGWTQIATVSANVTTYSDASLSCNTPYYYRIRAYRSGDVSYSTYSNLANATTYRCQSIDLGVGWNLISFNLHPVDTKVAMVLNSLAGNYDLVYVWDASGAHASAGNWTKFDPVVPPFVNSLENLDEKVGFWIHMTTADTLVVSGTAPVSTNINLYTAAGGWNLIGYPSASAGTLPDVLLNNGVGVDYTLVFAYHVSDTADPWKLFDRTAPVFVNDLKSLTTGWGYWIYMTADHTWTVTY